MTTIHFFETLYEEFGVWRMFTEHYPYRGSEGSFKIHSVIDLEADLYMLIAEFDETIKTSSVLIE